MNFSSIVSLASRQSSSHIPKNKSSKTINKPDVFLKDSQDFKAFALENIGSNLWMDKVS